MALLATSCIEMDLVEIARCCQLAEHEYAGTHCGIMDQFVCCFGAAGHAIMLDCRSLKHRLLPIKEGISIVICNSKVKHELAFGEYNARRRDCEESMQHLRHFKPEITALRDLREADLELYRENLSEVAFRRCRHVITENARVHEAGEMLKIGNMARFGQLIYESHRSLRDLYEVSCLELDTLVDLAAEMEGVYGARMTGGGFGGCTVNLVEDRAVDEFITRIEKNYEASTGVKPDVYTSAAGDGAGTVEDA